MTKKRYYLEDFKDFTVITLRLYDNEIEHNHYDWLTDCNKIVDLLNELHEENQYLKSENNMLKTTIGRNEAHISKLQSKGEWDNHSNVELKKKQL